ncbi:MAG TPA: hypothetical protein VGF34_15010 [Stellaceae bacterium]|jgi:hypothetical protein
MVEISYHRKNGCTLLSPATRAGRPSPARDRLSLRVSMLAVTVASLLSWAVVAAVIYVIVTFA